MDMIKLADKVRKHIEDKKNKTTLSLDLTSLGYTKLLGRGKIGFPLMVNISSYSGIAAEKIKEAGGQVLSEAQGNGE